MPVIFDADGYFYFAKHPKGLFEAIKETTPTDSELIEKDDSLVVDLGNIVLDQIQQDDNIN